MIAWRALGWIVADEARASRFLALTGLGPDDLRARIADPDLHAAIFAFLAGNEADLVACADALDLRPEELAAAAGPLQR